MAEHLRRRMREFETMMWEWDIECKRDELAKVYPTESWKRQVRNMPVHQVLKVYSIFEKDGKLEPGWYERRQREIQKKMDEKIEKAKELDAKYHQMSIFEFIGG